MSMEIYLLSDQEVASTQAWQKAVDALGFDVRFLDDKRLQEKEVRLRAEYLKMPVLMEISRSSVAELRETFSRVAFPEHIAHVHILRWSISFEGTIAAYQAAAAYVGLVKGLMIDSEEGKLKTPDQTIELARGMAADMAVAQDALFKLYGQTKI